MEDSVRKKSVSRSRSHNRKRSHSSSSCSSSSISPDRKRQKPKKKYKKSRERSSSSCSSSSTSTAEEYKKKKRKKLKKKAKKLKKEKRAKKCKKDKKSKEKELCDVPISLMDKAKAMAPMTKEEWEKKQNVVRRVFDEETGRHRLIKGEGEVLEEIVSRDRHKAINRQATLGDGNFFQSKINSSIKK